MNSRENERERAREKERERERKRERARLIEEKQRNKQTLLSYEFCLNYYFLII